MAVKLQESHNLAEKTAFFDAYASLGGDAATSFFDGILNPKGFLSKKEDPQTRACAAAALGKLGTSRALDALTAKLRPSKISSSVPPHPVHYEGTHEILHV